MVSSRDGMMRPGLKHAPPAPRRKAASGGLPDGERFRLLERGMRHQTNKSFDKAADYYQRILQAEPANNDALYLLAQVEIERGNFDAAIRALDRLRKSHRKNAQLIYLLAQNYYHLQRYPDALRELRRCLKIDPTHVMAMLLGAQIHTRLGQRNDGAQFLDQIDSLGAVLDPEEAITRAEIEAGLGRLDEARRGLVRLAAMPDFAVHALFALHNMPGAKPDDPVFDSLNTLLDNAATSEEDRVYIHHALGDLEAAAGNYDKSFDHFHEANAGTHGYDLAPIQATADELEGWFTADFMKSRRNDGHESRLPVFIIGLPRSGKSQFERFLCGHPHIGALGEVNLHFRIDPDLCVLLDGRLPQAYAAKIADMPRRELRDQGARYLEEMTRYNPDAQRLTNTLPQNFLNVGVLAILFPRARFIHIRRSPLDTCLFCYMKNFKNAHTYASDLATLGGYYRIHDRLMQHWHSVIPDRMLTVHYEDFVREPAPALRDAVAFLGLDPESALVGADREPIAWSYETSKNAASLDTAYVGFWRNYRAHLGPLIEALGPLADVDGRSKMPARNAVVGGDLDECGN